MSDPTAIRRRLFLLDDIEMEETAPGTLEVRATALAHRAPLRLDDITPALASALETLRAGASLEELAPGVLAAEGVNGLARLHHYIALLQQRAMLGQRLLLDDEVLAALRPLSAFYRAPGQAPEARDPLVLSRFALCRNAGNRLVLESPRGFAEVELVAPAAHRAVLELTRPRCAVDLAAEIEGLNVEAAAALLALFDAAAAVVSATDDGRTEETTSPELAPWAFHDLYFHSRSRLGRHANPYGGTYPFEDVFEPLPVVKPAMSNRRIELLRPDLDAVAGDDLPFTRVLEARRSRRRHGDPPISVQQLGEFLYRSARIRQMVADAGVSFRPSPAGGAIHELEIYALVTRCTGLEPGSFHYDPAAHCLTELDGNRAYVGAVLDMAAITAQLDQHPQVLLVYAARFQRMQLKYESMAYAAILKHVGALFQTMYLVATAMGLAPCALGGGHSDLFARATGLDYYAETSVGEFILGSAGPEDEEHGAITTGMRRAP